MEIDEHSGFCFGVVNAIRKAEQELARGELYCIGDIVHNSLEVERLEQQGLRTIDHEVFAGLRDCRVLFRAHGEPPASYETARRNGVEVIDASCPVVLHLQGQIREAYERVKAIGGQVVIYGKSGHAEVNGLVGQTEGSAIVVETVDDLQKIDFKKDICLFSQTTKSLDGFKLIVDKIQQEVDKTGVQFKYHDTICRQVANRLPNVKAFASGHDYIYFVAGRKSSNGKMLYEECRKANPNSIFISDADEIIAPLPVGVKSVGVCGATSTPKWLMEQVAEKVRRLNGDR